MTSLRADPTRFACRSVARGVELACLKGFQFYGPFMGANVLVKVVSAVVPLLVMCDVVRPYQWCHTT